MIKNEKYKKEILEKLILESSSIKEVLEKMNIRAAGGNYKIFHRHVALYNLDISHFEERIKIYQRTLGVFLLKNKKPLKQILKENSSFSRTSLKVRLYKEGIKKHECEECGQGEIWRGKKMSLILDHINGIHNDNRIENLRIICPNCNSTMETHAGKNTKKAIEKREKNSKQEKYIADKPLLEKRKVQRPSLDVLKKEIDELGYSATGRKYGVSDNAIRKWIKSYEKYGV